MNRRARVIGGAAAAVILVALAAAYLTGFLLIGDPLSGTWNTNPEAALGAEGTWKADGPDPSSGIIIKRTSSGYVFAGVVGTILRGWYPLERHGRVLDSKAKSWRVTFEYQPWSGHLVSTDQQGGHQIVLVLKKVTDSTSVPPKIN